VQGPVTQGLHRVTWDLRDPAATLPQPRGELDDLFGPEPGGPLVLPGMYQVSIAKRVGGVVTSLDKPQEFKVVIEAVTGAQPADRQKLAEFHQKVARLQRAVSGTLESSNALTARLDQIKRALEHTPGSDPKHKEQVRKLEQENRDILRILRGDISRRSRNENSPMSVSDRLGEVVEATRFSLGKPTGTQQEQYAIAAAEFATELEKLRKLMDGELRDLEKALDLTGAPWTPGRLPVWKDR
jgi:hypothetical protein